METDRWSELEEVWPRYQDAVRRWLEATHRPGGDAAEIDELTHRLIAAHNEWSRHLGAVLEATHHH